MINKNMVICSIMTFIISVYSVSSNAQTTSAQYEGTIERVRDAGMVFYYMNEKMGRHIFLGAAFEIQENKAKHCVEDGEENNNSVVLEGVLEEMPSDTPYSKEFSFKDDKFVCSNLKNMEHTQTLIGPKIFGFQLGMNRSNVNNACKELMKKQNLRERSDGPNVLTLASASNPDEWYISLQFDKENVLDGINISNRLFGVSNLHNQEFLQGFINHYDIPELKLDKQYNQFIHDTIVKYYYKEPHIYDITIDRFDVLLKKDHSPKPTFQ